jgi:large subunit ribosomal protein L5
MAKEEKEKKGGGGGSGGAPAKTGGAPKGGGAPKAQKREGERKSMISKTPHAGRDLPVPPPRLREHYRATVKPKLMKQFGFSNTHQAPSLEKIVLNVGLGEAIKQPKMLDTVVDELSIITGQRPVRKRAKKSIANYGLRQGQEIGAAVTLRGARMWEFLDRFISATVPRIRDFRGLSTRSFDGRGNYSLGVKEQMIFPEINFDMVEQIHGMDITIVTTAGRDDHALALLRELGMPFRGDEKEGRGSRVEARG